VTPSRPTAAFAGLVWLALGAGASYLACAAPAGPPPVQSRTAPLPVAPDLPDASAPLVHVQILAFNDFHGNLEPPSGTNGVVLVAPDDPLASSPDARGTDAGVLLVPAGGAAYLAALVGRLRAENAATVVVSAGDLTGASPLVSNLYADEPSVRVMNRLGLDFEGVGNHDFDRGLPELMRLGRPGCSMGDCDAGPYPGASFEYLGANVIDTATGRPALAPYALRDFGGARVAFIGETLAQTPSVTTAAAVRGLSFSDEADTANALVPELQKQGVSAIVLLLHQGGRQAPGGTYDGCRGFTGDVLPILDRLSPAIEVVISGHTHQAYDCVLGGRLVTSAASYGRLLTRIDLTLDPAGHHVVEKHARNIPVTRTTAPDGDVAGIVQAYAEKARGVTGRIVGYVKQDLTGNARAAHAASCETPLGDLIADAMLASSGAEIAFMNPGGIRSDLVARHPGRSEHAVTYADAFEVQPFGNALVTLRLRGAQIEAVLERQFGTREEPRILQVSAGFSYRYAYDRALRRGAISAMRLNGKPIAAGRIYRVTVPSFLAGGGDGFTMLAPAKPGPGQGPGPEGERDRTDGAIDVDALAAYLAKASSASAPLEAPKGGRIEGDGCR
jgi:5'-nucleotidase